MQPAELVSELRSLGVELKADGHSLFYRPAAHLPAELREELEAQKEKLLPLLSADWPPGCRDTEQRFGQPHARLFPLLKKRVSTPIGPGWLRAVHHPWAWVRIDGEEKLAKISWEEVRPEPGAYVP